MNTFLDNARRIFDVARATGHAGDGEGTTDFSLFVRADGGLHILMEAAPTHSAGGPETAGGAAYRVTRSFEGIRITGRDGNQTCVFEDKRKPRLSRDFLRDQPLYTLAAPLLGSPAFGSPAA